MKYPLPAPELREYIFNTQDTKAHEHFPYAHAVNGSERISFVNPPEPLAGPATSEPSGAPMTYAVDPRQARARRAVVEGIVP
jgi:hypothetical protein